MQQVRGRSGSSRHGKTSLSPCACGFHPKEGSYPGLEEANAGVYQRGLEYRRSNVVEVVAKEQKNRGGSLCTRRNKSRHWHSGICRRRRRCNCSCSCSCSCGCGCSCRGSCSRSGVPSVLAWLGYSTVNWAHFSANGLNIRNNNTLIRRDQERKRTLLGPIDRVNLSWIMKLEFEVHKQLLVMSVVASASLAGKHLPFVNVKVLVCKVLGSICKVTFNSNFIYGISMIIIKHKKS